jgi:hypothetical protein
VSPCRCPGDFSLDPFNGSNFGFRGELPTRLWLRSEFLSQGVRHLTAVCRSIRFSTGPLHRLLRRSVACGAGRSLALTPGRVSAPNIYESVGRRRAEAGTPTTAAGAAKVTGEWPGPAQRGPTATGARSRLGRHVACNAAEIHLCPTPTIHKHWLTRPWIRSDLAAQAIRPSKAGTTVRLKPKPPEAGSR